jgi:hypothetical protein
MPLRFTDSGSKSTEAWLNKLKDQDLFASMEKFGAMGVAALAAATPMESGITANSWGYEIERRKGYFSIRWTNSNRVAGKPLVILLQYGHGTNNGGYVQGRDFINPAIRPIFDQIDAEFRRVVSG